jgi:hypothetical protein
MALSHGGPARLPAVPASLGIDSSFGQSGITKLAGSNGATGAAVVPAGDPDAGDIVVSAGDGTHFQVARFLSSGRLDAAFAGGLVKAFFSGQANALTVVPPGRPNAGDVVAVGASDQSSCGSGIPTPAVAEFLPSGAINSAFGSGGLATIPCSASTPLLAQSGSLNGVAVDASGNIDVAGVAYGTAKSPASLVASLTSSGKTTRWTVTKVIGNAVGETPPIASQANAIAYSPVTGDVVVTGYSEVSTTHYLSVAAFNGTTGAADSGFGAAGVVQFSNVAGAAGDAVVVLPSGNIVAAGSAASNTFLVQFTKTGSPVTTFGSGGQIRQSPSVVGGILGLAYQPSGNVLVAAGDSHSNLFVAEYSATNGAPNTGFGSNGQIQESSGGLAPPPASVAVQTDGKVVAAWTAPVVHAVAGIGVLRVMGPSLSVANLPTVQVHSSSPLTVHFTASLNEPLFNPVKVTLCGAPSGVVNVNGQGRCAVLSIPAGATHVSVPVTIGITTTVGHSQTVTLSPVSGGGVSAGSTGSVVVQHLPAPASFDGYWLVASDGGVFPFHVGFYGSTGGIHLNQPVVGMANTPNGKGYWLVASDGGIFNFGNAHFYGSTGGIHLNKPIVAMAETPDGRGYWLVASDGGIFNFGDAHFYGSTGSVHLNRPIVGMAPSPDGHGYWLVASDGGIFNFGDAGYKGSAGGRPLPAPVVGMATFPGAPGYWLAGADGSVYSYGAAPFEGSTTGRHLNKPVVAIAPTSDGHGYWMTATDGGIFNFGDAHYFGSTGGIHLNKPIVGMSG